MTNQLRDSEMKNFFTLIQTILIISLSCNTYSAELVTLEEFKKTFKESLRIKGEKKFGDQKTLPIVVPKPKDLDMRKFQDVLNNPLFKTKGGFSSGGGGNGVVCFNEIS